MADEYFAWMDDQLKAGRRATGGEPCRVCEEPIESRAAWKHRDRHVCSSRCNSVLIRRWKAKIRKGVIDGFTPQPIRADAEREPRLFRTLPVTAGFPYEFSRAPVAGDIIERHGHHTIYAPIPAGTQLPWQAESVLSDDISGRLTPVLICHQETEAWTIGFFASDQSYARLSLGIVWWRGQVLHTVGQAPIPELGGLYFSFEFILDVDPEGEEFRWEAQVFTPLAPEKLWTPARHALSEKRRRTSNAKGRYNSRMRSLGVVETDAEDVDPLDIFIRDGWVCRICRGTIDSSLVWPDPGSPSLDHIIPVTRGGSHSKDNLQSSHLACNVIKNDAELSV